VEAQLNPLMDKHVGPQLKSIINQNIDDFKKSGGYVKASLTPLTDIHLHSNKTAELDGNGSVEYVYIFSGIALLILLIACVNFMNLSTARSSNRAKEVGVRKVLGSLKKNLIQQFFNRVIAYQFNCSCVFPSYCLVVTPLFQSACRKGYSLNYFIAAIYVSVAYCTYVDCWFAGWQLPRIFLIIFSTYRCAERKAGRRFQKIVVT
jgi:putative ABC transport system permease protein